MLIDVVLVIKVLLDVDYIDLIVNFEHVFERVEKILQFWENQQKKKAVKQCKCKYTEFICEKEPSFNKLLSKQWIYKKSFIFWVSSTALQIVEHLHFNID